MTISQIPIFGEGSAIYFFLFSYTVISWRTVNDLLLCSLFHTVADMKEGSPGRSQANQSSPTGSSSPKQKRELWRKEYEESPEDGRDGRVSPSKDKDQAYYWAVKVGLNVTIIVNGYWKMHNLCHHHKYVMMWIWFSQNLWVCFEENTITTTTLLIWSLLVAILTFGQN